MTITCMRGCCAFSARVTAIPSISGMRTSVTAMSKCSLAARSSARAPLSHAATV